MRVYISGPITGVADYKERFRKAEIDVIAMGYDAVNPALMGDISPQFTYEEHMRLDMLLLDMCDAIYMMNGWQKSCGANREYGYALAKDMIILTDEK